MFEYRKNKAGDSILPVKDWKLDATYAGVAKYGDVVKLNASGDVVAAATDDIAVLGVFVGKTIKMEKETVEYGKVIDAEDAVFEANVSAGTPVVGTKYPIVLTAGDYAVNASKTTTPAVVVTHVRQNGNVLVSITGRQI